MTDASPDRDLIFGAARHDPAFWRDHPMIAESEAHFDGDHGWVGLTTRDMSEPRQPSVTAAHVSPAETRDAPDLYFFGEGDCPIWLFEHAPAIREVRVAIEGPIAGDSRTCWSVGLWREPQTFLRTRHRRGVLTQPRPIADGRVAAASCAQTRGLAVTESELAAMTTNERLFLAGLLDTFAHATSTRDRPGMMEILGKVELGDQAAKITDGILADPKRYGF